jgi:DNA-binding NarL/FixJ family response regulator/tetratricopeptide (TPR) repeat protein
MTARLSAAPWGTELPFVGRHDELQAMKRHLTNAIDGRGHCLLVTGDAGVGKSRLLAALAREAQLRNAVVASGSAFAMEAGVPYGALADALSRPLRALDAAALALLARGAEEELRAVVPGLQGVSTVRASDAAVDGMGKSRLLWNVTQFLVRFAARTPLLLVLDNAHDSDASSLELLHFLARQVAGSRILIVLAYLDDGREQNPALREMTRSLITSREATVHRVEALTEADLAELLQRSLGLDAVVAQLHAAPLWSHTRGNPFFLDESLKALMAGGQIRHSAAGWTLDEALPATLPATIRDTVLARLDRLDDETRRVAEVAAILESRASLPLLERVTALSANAIADAIDTLCARRLFVEYREGDVAEYAFAHPILQSTVRSTLTAARERVLHASVASALESLLGPRAFDRAGEVARHLVLGHARGSDERTLRYLLVAGRDALRRRADHEALRWLREALALADDLGESSEIPTLLDDLATAEMRAGHSADATALYQRALSLATEANDQQSRARVLHHLAQVAARSGDASAGLAFLTEAAQAVHAHAPTDAAVRIGLTRAKLLQSLGRHQEATESVGETLNVASNIGDASLSARVHQTALQLYAWTGPVATAREHGALAIALASASEDRAVEWSAHWAMAMLEGFTGDVPAMERHLGAASTLADQLASPVLQALTAEIAIEHASGVGRWDEALAIAERTIPLARVLMPQSLLPRVLVWTALILLERDEVDRAHALLEEAWELSAGVKWQERQQVSEEPLSNVHNVILAHTGMGAYWLSRGEWSRALEFGERGLAIADRFGYVAWAIHRLIPTLIEASLRTQDYARVDQLSERLRTQSTVLGHRLGLAWAAAADALVARVRDQRPDAAERLIAAADALDAVPFVFHAAKIRRNAAQLLEADGDAVSAVRELRRAHVVFARLGAEFELRGVRDQLRSLGVRLPPRQAQSGMGELTSRELDIARAVAQRLTNKEIGARLQISSRTVSTHLSNIFEKLGVDSRGALADLVRDDPRFLA